MNEQARFDKILEYLEFWRNEDHEDSIVIYRTDIISIIEGVKRLKKAKENV